MTFYQAMQLSANVMNPMIKNAENKKEKNKYILAFILKNILCMLFCIVFVSTYTKIFGEENSVIGVSTVILILTFRFSNLNFNVKQSTLTLFGVFLIYLIGPLVVLMTNPFIGFIVNFICIITLVVSTCNDTKFSNHSTIVLCYILILGTSATTTESFIRRIYALICGGILVSGIFYYKQRKNKYEKTFIDVLKEVSFADERTRWQIKLALGISGGMFLGALLNIPRVIWIGFACLSYIQQKPETLQFRLKNRPLYILFGSVTFCITFLLIPEEYRMFLSLFGGIAIGFAATYQYQIMINCFGALSSAVPILGILGAVFWRIACNVFGAIFCFVYDKIYEKIYLKTSAEKTVNNAA